MMVHSKHGNACDSIRTNQNIFCGASLLSFYFCLAAFRLPSLPLRLDKNMLQRMCVWPAEINCCIPAGYKQVLLNLLANINLLSKQLRICVSHVKRSDSLRGV